MKKIILLLTLIDLTQTSSAYVLEAGQRTLRIDRSQGTAKDIYRGRNKVAIKELTSFAVNGTRADKRDVNNTTISTSFGIGNNSQVDFGATYSEADTGLATRDGISEVTARYLYQLFDNGSFDMYSGFAFRAPADGQNGNAVVATSDGINKFDYSLDFGYSFDQFKIGLNNKYTDRRLTGARAQTTHEVNINYFPTEVIQIVASYVFFKTHGGLVIGGDGFAGRYSIVQEQYRAYNLAFAYVFGDAYSADIRFGQKLTDDIRNTDLNTTIGVGLNANF